jgi:hypothetical protein
MNRWSVDQVAAVAPSPRAVAAAEPLAGLHRWASSGSDDRAIWGRCRGSGAEPYDTIVDHVEVAWRCSCPSRKLPCKHAVALLLMWARGLVVEQPRPVGVGVWIDARDARTAAAAAVADVPGTSPDARPDAGPDTGPDTADTAGPPGRDDLTKSRDERVARMLAGLVELERWLEDRMANGLSDPALARYATWDDLAARLVDARAGALANRVRRLAGLVGAGPDWHSDVLAELGILHLIAQAGLRLPELPGSLGDAAATASGWQVRQLDVLAGVPDTDDWFVAGRSDVREDRIEVRRLWLYGQTTKSWVMLLSFAAYQQVLDDSFTVGTVVRGDMHRYPGGSLRALAGRREADPLPFQAPVGVSIADACRQVGRSVAEQPWLDRLAITVSASPTLHMGRWLLGDGSGALPLLADERSLASLLAASCGADVIVTVEWTPRGLVPLTVHLPDRTIDIGPRADPTFVRGSGGAS